ncbi:MAG: carbohydrate-binding family 9-like protein [Proteobacteria bacterium]|nr:carbohydrate-binding family 9-like protein [Pseudomonadota bacterium]
MKADMGQKPWADISAQTLSCFMGDPPSHRPVTRFKIAWDHHLVCVIFEVQDRYVRAVAKDYQDPVYQDSCVEFFFSPNPHVDSGYFNLEINCGGTGLFEFHPSTGGDVVPMPLDAFKRISILPTLGRNIDPEMRTPTTWSVEYTLPVDILADYCPVTPPAKGVFWRGNFYKCADASSHPHWLTWAPVDFPRPRFHLPEYFGWLAFD